ncbi:MAG: gamma-glutamylcyclotransferase [Desulfocapsaceae bacterium]|nr:gamma-glutamylcyclotransferase [Desulfocapsaceae bacterium]
MENFFAYGSLMCGDILSAVVGQPHRHRLAVLPDYRRFSVKNEQYPAVVPNSGHSVPGLVYHDITPAEWGRLDRFEQERYDRRLVRIFTEDGCRMQAWCYVFRPEFRLELTGRNWDFGQFLAKEKQIFVARYLGFRHIEEG